MLNQDLNLLYRSFFFILFYIHLMKHIWFHLLLVTRFWRNHHSKNFINNLDTSIGHLCQTYGEQEGYLQDYNLRLYSTKTFLVKIKSLRSPDLASSVYLFQSIKYFLDAKISSVEDQFRSFRILLVGNVIDNDFFFFSLIHKIWLCIIFFSFYSYFLANVIILWKKKKLNIMTLVK